MGNLFASVFIKAPLEDRYGNIKSFQKMLDMVCSDRTYTSFEQLIEALQ